MNMLDEEILDELGHGRNHSENTKDNTDILIQAYTKFHKMPMYKLIGEAEAEEDKRIKWRKSKLRND